jgi:CHAD domain-containing protein
MILEQSGCRPETWSAKPACPVSPEMTVREAVRRLATASLDICRRCEAGIIEDVDTEFLHDYRVSLRRLRSTLKLIKDAYPADVTARVSAELGQFARRTNRLRDLDVYLLNRDEYVNGTPPDLRDALGEMFEDLAQERSAEQQAVAAHLGSDAYRTTMRRLFDVFDEDKWWPVTVNSHASVFSLANHVLPRRYEKIRRMHSAIAENSPDGQVHDVRLQAKKLRYLLEFFGTLYPPQRVDRLIKRLKKLQNTLGTFNDLVVQQASLQGYVYRKSPATPSGTALILAVGSLLGILHRRHQEVRHEVFRSLAAFTGDETQSLVQELFKEGSRAA